VSERDDRGLSVLSPGLWVHRGAVPAMPGFHRHDDLEINVVLDGQLEYLFGGERLVVRAGQTALFWAAASHRLIAPDLQQAGDVCWVHVPLRTALRWSLPASFGSQVLAQHTLVVPTDDLGDHVPDQFLAWQRDLAASTDTAPLLLEANALVLRILAAHERRGASPERTGGDGAASLRRDLRPVAAMARFTAERFRDPISTADIARAAGLHPNYATTLFRESVGTTLGEHLLRHRIAEAQRLLITTSLTATSVAHAAGFGSSSSLYAHFARACGCAPGEYRAARLDPARSEPVTRTGSSPLPTTAS
jgi:AraC-like DNA-binding protein